MNKSLFTLLATMICFVAFGQTKDAPWVSYPSANNQSYGVYHFRKVFDLATKPEKAIVHVSGDNRYNLFVNGKRVCYGPAKGDLKTFKYDVIDIAKYLQSGNNVIAAVVLNMGKDRADAIISAQTAFMLRAEDQELNKLVESNENWKVYKNPAYSPISYVEMLYTERWFYGYYACGPGDRVDGIKYPWGWELSGYDDTNWLDAEMLMFDQGKTPWNLVPRNIPFMDSYIERPAKLRLVEKVDASKDFLSGTSKITVAANTKAKILLEYDVFTMGYPELTVDKGNGSKVQVKYAEALYEKVNLKAHRDSVNNLWMAGVWDEFYPDGQKRTFRPLWKRAFKYVQLNIETGDEPLDVLSFQSEYSGYPYKDMATFKSVDDRINQIFAMCQQTLRMCSAETYYDTPYYEQLSYGGDNRPIGNISIYNSTDDRLFREVMRIYPQSQSRETGIMRSTYPSKVGHREMGTWSLAWIQSLHDYYFLRGDSAYVKQFTGNIEGVLNYYHRNMDESKNILNTVISWNFTDWSITKGSLPRVDEKKRITHSILLTLYYLHTLDCTSRMYEQIGLKEEAASYNLEADQIRKAVKDLAWDSKEGLFRDYPDKNAFSQHTNIFAILCDVVPEAEQEELLEKILSYKGFEEYASSYFTFFLFKAMEKTGRQDLYLENLDHWQNFLDRGLTTAGETGFASHDRSDCHAWSAHPAYHLLSMVCGIRPADIGFNTVRIAPELGHLTSVDADMPHPKGRIAVSYQVKKGKLKGTVTLPKGLTGTWEYQGSSIELNEGLNKIR